MTKKLQFLIPQYNETETDIKNLLDSIEIQQNIDMDDIGAIIVNDGSDIILSDDFLNSYSYDIKYIKADHKGVSATRNAALDAASADYVMFCDADDMFYNACGLYIVFREIEKDGFDTLVSAFVEETRDPATKEPLYITHDIDQTFVHGKIHRRKFLLKNNIKWNNDLTIHEDSYFNCLCQNLAKNAKYSATPFYLWKWRDNSVCRHDPKYILKTYNNMLDSNTALINQFLKRDLKEEAMYYATAMIYDAYFTMNKDEWLNQENKEYRKAVEDRFAIYWKDFKHLHNTISEEKKNQIIISLRNRMFAEGMILETQTFADWIKQFE